MVSKSFLCKLLDLCLDSAGRYSSDSRPQNPLQPTNSMKITSFSRNPFHRTLATIAIAIVCASSIQPARAGYIVTLQRIGPDVVANGSGAIDLTGTFSSTGFNFSARVSPIVGEIFTGPTTGTTVGVYSSPSWTGPTTFGSGGPTFANSGSGDFAGIFGQFEALYLPSGYVSGTALSDTATYKNQGLKSLGVTPGTYVWTWGPGADQNFTLKTLAGVPDSGSTFSLLSLSLASLFGVRRFRSRSA